MLHAENGQSGDEKWNAGNDREHEPDQPDGDQRRAEQHTKSASISRHRSFRMTFLLLLCLWYLMRVQNGCQRRSVVGSRRSARAATCGILPPREILSLERRQLDLKAGTLRLEPGTTKNGEGRVGLPYPGASGAPGAAAGARGRPPAAARAHRAVSVSAPRRPAPSWRSGRYPRCGFAKRWRKACAEAGVPGRIPHDFRRTAVRNLERADVARSVAMKITGHKTESVYRRYTIVSDADLQEATRRLTAASASPV